MGTQLDKIGEAAAKATADLVSEAAARPEWSPPRYPSLAAALAVFQSTRPDLEKTSTADVIKEGRKIYSYGYSTLADVEKAVLPGLGAVGLSWTCHTTLHGNQFVLVCILQHESGEATQSVFPLRDKDTEDPQALGSKLTYWRRYALMLATGVSPESDDDDGQRAQAANAHDRYQRGEHQMQHAHQQPPQQQARQERPSPGPGTRQGAADRYARELLTGPLDGLRDTWINIAAGGHQSDTPTADGVKFIREYLAKAEIPADSLPGKLIGWSTGALAHIAGFRLLLSGWTAQAMGSARGVAEADKAYMALCQIETNFGRLNVTPEQRLGDWLAMTSADMHRKDTPVTSATVPYGRMDQAPDVSGYDADDPPWDTSANSGGGEPDQHDRPAVLEGT